MNKYVKRVGRVAQSIFRFFGMDLFPYKQGYHYVPDIYGHAAYKQVPLNRLPVFGDLASKVIQGRQSTLYYDRLDTIFQGLGHLRRNFAPAEKLNLVEVGVFKGGTSFFIASVVKHFQMNARHYAFDTFEGHDARDVNPVLDPWHRPGTFSDTRYESVNRYLSRFGNLDVHKGRFQDNCHLLQGKKIHFVHFDVDIYAPTIFGLNFFHQCLVPGGIIIVDDYGFTTCPGVKDAVDEFVRSHSMYFALSLLTGQYLLVRLQENL